MSTFISILSLLIESLAWVYGILILGDTDPDAIFMILALSGVAMMFVALLLDMRKREKASRHKKNRNA
jgi:hypothetical protein